MINRALLRTKVVQVLYASFIKGNADLNTVESELKYSIEKAYDLYNYILLFMVEMKRYADLRNEAVLSRLDKSGTTECVSQRFLSNKFIAQLAENKQLISYAETNGLTWADNQDLLKNIFGRMVESDYYRQYIKTEASDYDADKMLWRNLLKNELIDNPDFESQLEYMSIYWMDDIHIVYSFVLKTIKQFKSETGDDQPLLPMFKNTSDRDYAIELADKTILNSDKLDEIIAKYLRNWDLERIAFMDMVILKTAIAELLYCPTIPANVTLNEYIDIAKFYSSPKSSKFVNGILDRIVTDYRKEIMK